MLAAANGSPDSPYDLFHEQPPCTCLSYTFCHVSCVAHIFEAGCRAFAPILEITR